ncbi:MAG: heme utilization cystosolic carrier protein HutX [Pseudorhodoplanes sp.]
MLAIDNLRKKMTDDPGALFETVAKEYDATLRQVVEAMPAEHRQIVSENRFVDAMTDIAEWGDVTLIIHSDDGIFEFSGPIPKGEMGRGYFNLAGSTGLHGHLRPERCGGMAFVERPFMNKLSASILFFNVDGGIMFKVFVGRDEKRELKADQLQKFRAMAERFGAKR